MGNNITKEKFENILLREAIDENSLFKIVPELIPMKGCSQNHPAHFGDVFTHTLCVLKGVPNEISLKILALFHDIGKPSCKVATPDGIEHFWGHEEKSAEMTDIILRRLDYEQNFIEKIKKIIKIHDTKVEPTEKAVKKAVNSLGKDNFTMLLSLQKADLLAHSEAYAQSKLPFLIKVKEIFDKIFNNNSKDGE